MGYDQKAASLLLKSHILSMPKPYIFSFSACFSPINDRLQTSQ